MSEDPGRAATHRRPAPLAAATIALAPAWRLASLGQEGRKTACSARITKVTFWPRYMLGSCSKDRVQVMNASELQAIGDTLMRLVTPEMTPKELVKAVRKVHPNAKKKDIARAAFHAIIANADQDLGKSRNLQAFALAERTQQAE